MRTPKPLFITVSNIDETWLRLYYRYAGDRDYTFLMELTDRQRGVFEDMGVFELNDAQPEPGTAEFRNWWLRMGMGQL